jgi:hypothetical protein
MAHEQDPHWDDYQDYLRAIKEDPKAYSSFADYLGANAMQMCEGCDKIVEYDEVDENGYCFDCQEEEGEEEEGEEEEEEDE